MLRLSFLLVFATVLQACTATAQRIPERRYAVDCKPPRDCSEDRSTNPDSPRSRIQPSDTDGDPRLDLPAYLFTLEDSLAIKELVEPFLDSGEDEVSWDGERTNRYGSLRNYVQDFVDQAMARPEFSPGRDFEVIMIGDETPNAAADAFQNIIIHAGAVEFFSSDAFLSTLCHEMAHSTRNHVAKSLRGLDLEESNRQMEAVFDRADDYLASTYNLFTGEYTHDESLYAPIRQDWDRLVADASLETRRDESEADIVGGMICAHFGMSAAQYAQAFRSGIGSIEPPPADMVTDAKQLKDGEVLALEPEQLEILMYLLLPFDSHPPTDERAKQLDRVGKAIDQYLQADSDLSREFQEAYGRQARLPLVGGAPKSWRPLAAGVGVKVPTCGHPHHRHPR